uniref:gamma-parvin-like n=1 Tax=Myxine glutinosa TaxID=7769 RepID=UPI00358DE78B
MQFVQQHLPINGVTGSALRDNTAGNDKYFHNLKSCSLSERSYNYVFKLWILITVLKISKQHLLMEETCGGARRKTVLVAEHGPMNDENRRVILHPSARNDPRMLLLQEVLLNWVNATLQEEEIKVRSIHGDFYDGLVLQHLIEKLGAVELCAGGITFSSTTQQRKLAVVLQHVDQLLGSKCTKWSVSLIHEGDELATTHLLVALVQRFEVEIHLPPGVSVRAILIGENEVERRTETWEQLTPKEHDHLPSETDVIDLLFERAPDKVQHLTEALLKFANKHLKNLFLSVDNLAQFGDGVLLILLVGQLEGFFVPLYKYHVIPESKEHKTRNVQVALELIEESEITHTSWGVLKEDIVNVETKSLMKVLHVLYSKHKTRA